ncbi:UDP-N-acetylglucosamine pyrophosphorylase [Puccinia graminis f. sp. tritici]|uniref:UDP-N-acetylglucosamine diphosphorylase n=1 Tax=Puccinia graminis f. sp. tritici TaxID=56615 RepID=A0A5B0S4C5_PUCGR|nr:UDP-N-acetylglucosamine pyrophosphorylase [Puccinia graminis f. sp. tritici]
MMGCVGTNDPQLFQRTLHHRNRQCLFHVLLPYQHYSFVSLSSLSPLYSQNSHIFIYQHLYAALRSLTSCLAGRSVLEDLKHRGAEYIHACCVDNCLVKVADLIFLGYCIGKKTPCGVKVVLKSQPNESVGVLALKNKQWLVVEYSEMPESAATIRAENEELKFKSANIANHFYSLKFLE